MPVQKASDCIAAPVSTESFEEKVFLDRPGILVTNSIFSISPGSSFPIRNISSVSVDRDPPRWLSWILAIVFTVNAFVFMSVNPAFGFVTLMFSIPFWYRALNRAYRLRIGAGGAPQIAIDSQSAATLEEVADAINGAILYMQSRAQRRV